MWDLTKIRYRIFESGLTAFLFWVIIGIATHVWICHGQDSAHNIMQIEAGHLITRLVHFSYILAGYSIYKIFHWLNITALQALGIVSVLSLGVSGWSIFKIGYHFKGKKLGWALSFLVLPLPLVLGQAQGQEYQPFATAMMALAWYFWIVRNSLLATSIAWATSVLANPANAFLFTSFTSFSLLESRSIKNTLYKSIRLWIISAFIVIAAWGPFYEELLFSKSWAVVPVMSKQASLFSSYRYLKAFSFLLYSLFSNFFIFILAVPFGKIKHRLQYMYNDEINPISREKIIAFVLSILISTSILSIMFGHAAYGRYYTPLLVWLALILLLGIIHVLPKSDFNLVLTRWRWVGVIQLLFVIFVVALPYKYKAYARYSDYHMIADKYSHYVVADTGALRFDRVNKIEKRLKNVYDLDYRNQRDQLRNMFTSGQIDQFIFVYGIDVFDRAILKQVIPKTILKKFHASASEAEDMLKYMGFNVKMEPLGGTLSDNIFLVKRP